MTGADVGAVALRLAPHAGEQGLAADAAREARVVVTAGNPGRAAASAVDDAEAPPKPRQIDRGRQARGARADHDTVQNRRLFRPFWQSAPRKLDPNVRGLSSA